MSRQATMTSTVVNPVTPQTSRPDRSGPGQEPDRVPFPVADVFARESDVDAMAYAAGADPVAFRLGLVDDDRLAAVIQAAARRFGWSSPGYPAGRPALWAKGWLQRGAGIAAGVEEGRRVATCAEVQLDSAEGPCVTRIVTAYECGALVSPEAMISEIEGGTVMTLGGLPLSRHQAPVSAGPLKLDVVLLDRPDLPSAGTGQTPLTAIAPAVANAIFAATGQRLRSLTLVPVGLPAGPVSLRTAIIAPA
jgi:nicotinate dehydrogenase subunit B